MALRPSEFGDGLVDRQMLRRVRVAVRKEARPMGILADVAPQNVRADSDSGTAVDEVKVLEPSHRATVLQFVVPVVDVEIVRQAAWPELHREAL